MLHAVIFDFDGVIADTERLHYEAFQEVLEPHGLGYSWEQYVDVYIGFDDRDGFREAYRRGNVFLSDETLEARIAEKAKLFGEIVEHRGVEAYDGVMQLVRELGGHVPIALCSGALASDIEPILNELRLAQDFKVIVTADDVEASKPDPASYRLAVERLAEVSGRPVDASHCVAVEDTPTGIEAAVAAGIKVLGVTHNHEANQLERAARTVDSFNELGLADFEQLVEE